MQVEEKLAYKDSEMHKVTMDNRNRETNDAPQKHLYHRETIQFSIAASMVAYAVCFLRRVDF